MSEWDDKCLFVANLPCTLNNMELSQQLDLLLSRFGSVFSIKASRDGKNRPFAFVQFKGPLQYDSLLVEPIILEDRQLRFEIAKSAPTNNHTTTDSVKNGYFEHNKHHQHQHQFRNLNQHENLFYPAPQAYVPYFSFDPSTQQQHTFQVPVQYSLPLSEMMQTANVYPVDEVVINSPEYKMFVNNLNGALVTQRKVLRRFQKYGHITDIELFKNYPDGSPRSDAFAFVSYLHEGQLFDAIKCEDGREWLEKTIKCSKALKKKNSHCSNNSNEDSL